MKAYSILLVITVLIALGTVYIVRRTGQRSFLLGISILYFWTFLGAWFFIGDAMSGYQGYRIGLNYYYLMEKMFPFELDANYISSILGYGAFTIALLLGVVLVSKRIRRDPGIDATPLILDHRVFLVLAIAACVVSFLIVRPTVLLAIYMREPIYIITRTVPYSGSTLHGLCNELAAYGLLLGWALFLTRGGAVRFAVQGQRWMRWAYPVLLLLLECYFMVLGNKHELFMALMLGLLVFLLNSRKIEARKLVLYIGICALPLSLTNMVRGFSLQEIKQLHPDEVRTYRSYSVPIIAHVPSDYETRSRGARLGHFLLSNEMFAAHFSLYGILRNDVHPVAGISSRYLVSAVVPRAVRSQRPHTSYEEYAEQARLTPGQGYTIHQAAGWYMNGGWPMLPLGGLLLGCIWGGLMKWNNTRRENSLVRQVVGILGTSCWVAYLPILVRDGPETAKGLVFEGFMIPMALVLIAAWSARHSFFAKRSWISGSR